FPPRRPRPAKRIRKYISHMPRGSSTGALAPGLVETERRSYRHVQAFHLTGHRNAHQTIAALAGETTHSLPFGAEDPCERPCQIALRQALGPRFIGAENLQAELLHLVQAVRKISDGDERHALGGAAGNLSDSGRQAHRAVLWTHHRVRT